MQAAAKNKLDANKEAFKLIRQAGGDINQGGSTASSPLVSMINTDRFDLVEWCLQNGAEIHTEQNGIWPLALMLSKNDPKFVDLYFEKMASIKSDEFLKQSLQNAIQSGKTEILARLLVLPVKFPMDFLQELLVEGCNHGEIAMLERLLLLKKDSPISDDSLKQLWNNIIRSGDIKAATLLLNNKIPACLSDNTPTAQISTLEWDHSDMLSLLINDYKVKLNLNINLLGMNRDKVVDKKFLNLFLTHGLDPNAKYISLSLGETTILNSAIHREDFESVKLLIDAGAHVNSSDSSMVSPLYKAIETKNYEIIKLLLETGANVNGKCMGENGKESTPLELARTISSLHIHALLNKFIK